jgi:hypothetical protein
MRKTGVNWFVRMDIGRFDRFIRTLSGIPIDLGELANFSPLGLRELRGNN